eukprot:g27489.t1
MSGDPEAWPEKAELERWMMNTVKDPDPGAMFLRQVLQMNPAYGSYLQSDQEALLSSWACERRGRETLSMKCVNLEAQWLHSEHLHSARFADLAPAAVILAAGRGARLVPYTDTLPTALISIAGKPLVAHTLKALRRQGVEQFYICRGWQGEVFDEHLEELGPGVQLKLNPHPGAGFLIDCPDFNSTGMLESLRLALRMVGPGPLYVCYGDIIFRPCVARRLLEAPGDLVAAVNGAAPGRQSKGFAEVESVSCVGSGGDRCVRRIGKGRRVREADATGEFAGLMKCTVAGPGQEDASCTGQAWTLPWWLEPVQRASLCDLLQLMADEGVAIHVAMGFGGWHEVNTCEDLTRAWNDTALFLSEEDTRTQVKAMGSCLLSEANDLKRPLPIVAKELNVSLDLLECLLRGDLEVSDALDVVRKMSEVYAVPLNDLWLDADDTLAGCRVFSFEQAESSSRVLDRQDRSGRRTPYYEYRDSAMSRCSQFRPEWIKAAPGRGGAGGWQGFREEAEVLDVVLHWSGEQARARNLLAGSISAPVLHPIFSLEITMVRRTAGSNLLLVALGALGLRWAFVGSSSSLRGNRVAMEAERKFIVGGNWKANGSPDSVKQLVDHRRDLIDHMIRQGCPSKILAPKSEMVQMMKRERIGRSFQDYAVAAQNLWDKDPGAWTGEIPAQMLADMGIKWVVLGHSERRENCGETSQIVAEKTKFAVDNGFSTLTCIGALAGIVWDDLNLVNRPHLSTGPCLKVRGETGEKLDAREGGKTFDVLDEQLKPLADVLSEDCFRPGRLKDDWEKVVLAYEPVWAIGTGKVATPEQAEETHAYIRKWLADNVSEKVSESVRIQYGGSVNDKNAAELGQQPNIDGFLVGGASLKGGAFTTIINSALLSSIIFYPYLLFHGLSSLQQRPRIPESLEVTYGGAVRRAFTELSRVGAAQVARLAGDWRDPTEARKCLLKRRLAAECLSFQDLAPKLAAQNIPAGRVEELLEGHEASEAELEALALVLHVRKADLLVSPLQDEEEVVVTFAADSCAEARRSESYVLAPLARTRHQPDLKTFDLEVLEGARPGH